MKHPPLGCTADDLDTPALCLDLDVMESNITKIAAQCAEHGVGWRPHAKGHKIPEIAKRQLAAGAIGITCAKLGEAEVMAQAGVRDILIANMISGRQKIDRLIELSRIADPIICIDHLEQAVAISEAAAKADASVRVLIEVDIGLARVGVESGAATLELAKAVASLPGLKLAGIMGYEGHLLTIPDLKEKAERIADALAVLVGNKRLLEENGIDCPIVSCAGTGSYQFSVLAPGITEVQAGGATYMDAFYYDKCQVKNLGFAMTVLTTVVSRPAPDRAIIDAGRKSINAEIHTPRVAGRDDIEVARLSAEHGQLRLEPSAQDLKIGDRLALIPGYGDLTTVLHDEMYGFRGGKLEVVWPIEGRGKIR